MAADSQQECHRPGPLKQQNKSHKHGKHRSKGQLERNVKGRVNIQSLSKKTKLIKKKNDRRYQAQQQRKHKREECLARKRSRGMVGTPPHCVAVISLHASVDGASAIRTLTHCDDTAIMVKNEQGITHLSVPRFKQRVEFLCPRYGHLYDILDAGKVADSLLLLLSPDGGTDDNGDYCLSCLLGQGLPAVTLTLIGLKDVVVKKQTEVKKKIQKDMERWFPTDKLHTLDTAQDGLLVLRHITSQKLKPVHYRENRPHMLAENIQFALDDSEAMTGTLKLTGFLRGQALSVNRLVHLPGWGDYQLNQADVLEDPYPLHPRNSRHRQTGNTDVEMSGGDTEPAVIQTERADPTQQESLQSEVVPDPMDGEQTWPTEQELKEATDGQVKKTVRKVPKGTSEYQAAWIIDSDNEEDDDDDGDSDDDDDPMDDAATDASMEDDEGEEGEDDEEYENITVTDGDDDAKYDDQIDMDEEMEMLQKMKEEKMHVMFPDEIDTPQDTTARTRFQKYRGLQSFRTSTWDANENLPLDYARVYQFDNFRHTTKRVLAGGDDVDGAIAAWSYVRIHIANVPKAFMENYTPGTPVVVFGLLPHEQKMSVVNIVVRKCADVTRPIKSKERLIFQVGFRRFSACPVFSQHTNGNKHKCERFLPQDMATVATMFAPIAFPPVSVLVFQEKAFGGQELVAKGTMMSVAPDRIITKRLVISGYPFKINKKSCVVRYMFFNREDINWFKPVELRTKWGRRGHIKEPLGTHGHMKCVFDGQLKSQDSILMNLYKRVFPRWTYNPLVSNPPAVTASISVTMDTIEEEKEGAAFAMFD